MDKLICENCKNNDVCKYYSELKSFKESNDTKYNNTPIVINIQCKERRV